MENKMNARKTRGAWMITVKECVEKKDVLSRADHQEQRASKKMEGGAR